MSTTDTAKRFRLDVGDVGRAAVEYGGEMPPDGVQAICADIAYQLKREGVFERDKLENVARMIRSAIRWQPVVTDKSLGDTGRLAKRIKKFIKRAWYVNPSEEMCKTISDAISCYSPTEFWYEVADHFDWVDGDFGDDGSCFWSCHSQAKDVLLGLGCRTLLLYGDEESVGDSTGIGRCIILPDEPEIGCHILFNAYGPSLETIGKALSRHFEVPWKWIELLGEPGTWRNLVYVNKGQGILLGETQYECRSHTISDEEYVRCEDCCSSEDYIAEGEAYWDEDGGCWYCEYHYDQLMERRAEEEAELEDEYEDEEEEEEEPDDGGLLPS